MSEMRRWMNIAARASDNERILFTIMSFDVGFEAAGTMMHHSRAGDTERYYVPMGVKLPQDLECKVDAAQTHDEKIKVLLDAGVIKKLDAPPTP